MGSTAYVVDVLTKGFAADVDFNGWPICRGEWSNGKVASQKLNFFLLAGENRLEASLKMLEPDDVTVDRWFELRMVKTRHDESERDDDVLLRYRWTPDESPVGGAYATPVFTHAMRVARAYGAWAWEAARPFLPSDRDAVLAVVAELHAALAARDAAAVLGLLQLKYDEWDRAVENPQGTMAGRERDFLARVFAMPDYGVAPFDPAALELESACGGRLVKVLSEDRGPAITAFADGGPFGTDVALAFVGGGWKILR
ncbi:MAG TPA: hypothetical protein VHB21_13750 [Minicystis sp.]|nr:hypothetical protein [Minicystis sp.]